MKPTLFILCFFFLSLGTTLMAQSSGDQILGIWANEEGTSHIEILQENGMYYGKVVWLKNPTDKDGNPHTDKNNPNEALQDREIMGLITLYGLKYKNGKWKNGHIYAPAKGKTLDASVEMASDDELKITASQGFFSKTRTMKRI